MAEIDIVVIWVMITV